MNTLFSKDITLDSVNHLYKLAENPDFDFTSSTQFISQFFEKFEPEIVAEKLVSQIPRYQNYTVQELLDEWNQASEFGKKIHNQIEAFIKNKETPNESRAINAINWLTNEYNNSNCKLYSEVVIYSTEIKIAGTIDLLVFNPDTKNYTIIDWKTSKKIPTTSFNNKTGTKQSTSNILDSKFNHYSMQLSLYKYILENFYDLKINNLKIAHLIDEQCKILIAEDFSHNIPLMLKEHGCV